MLFFFINLLFHFFSVTDGFGRFGWDVSQKYPVNAGVPEGSIFDPTLFQLCIIDLSNDVICNIAIFTDDTTLSSQCDQVPDLLKQLELAFELESWAGSGLLILMLEKLNWFLLTGLTTLMLLM